MRRPDPPLAGPATAIKLFLVLTLVALASVAAQAQTPDPGIAFLPVPTGEFLMGCSSTDSPYLPDGAYAPCEPAAQPAHRVAITRPFELGRYEVTQAQWEAVMGTNPSHFRGPDRPVETIHWDDVQEFLTRLNQRNDGYRYRLPTEAEWEYAARAGSTGIFGGIPLRDGAWYGESGNVPLPESRGATHPVGQKSPNAWGFYDMLGNVEEWVADWYGEGYAATGGTATDPQGPAEGEYHVARGGSWFSISRYLRVSNRYQTVRALRRSDTGLRLARERRIPAAP